MKIIKKRKIPTTTIRFYCGNCGCVFECEKGEYTYWSDQRDGDYYTAKCPTCGKLVQTVRRKEYIPTMKRFS